MKSIELSSVDFKAHTFGKGSFSSVSISECEFLACVFDQVRSKSVSLGGGSRQSRYVKCFFKGCDFNFFALGNALFDECSFEDCRLANLFSVAGEFIDCSFAGTTIRRGTLNGKVPEDFSGPYRRKMNRVERNDFSHATLVDFDFRGGVNLVESQLPLLPHCVFVSDTCAAAKRLAGKGRSGGLQRLLEHYCKEGQRQQLIYPPFSEDERSILTSIIAA
jgi:uncharacterized protein YjbI with pentapeptide repeats